MADLSEKRALAVGLGLVEALPLVASRTCFVLGLMQSMTSSLQRLPNDFWLCRPCLGGDCSCKLQCCW